MRVLVSGASGYVGSRLVPALLRRDVTVRAASRHPSSLARFDWHADVETVAFDCLDPDTLSAALADVDTVYYLVHALGDGDFETSDRVAAQNLAAAAKAAGVSQIVYLGGFVPDGERLSDHLDSRAEVGEILVSCGIDTVWLKAAVIVGAGSTSFEIIRYVADRLPVIPAPKWMETLVQPIAVDDTLYYLAAALDLPAGEYDIAGEERFPYRELIERYIRLSGQRRYLLPLRFVSTGMASGILGRLTPVPTALAADLVESLNNTMVVGDDRIRSLVPDPPGGLTAMDDAIRRALALTAQDGYRVVGAAATPDSLRLTDTDPSWAGGDVYRTTSTRRVAAPVDVVWARIAGIGGVGGWSSWPVGWRARGVLGALVGRGGLRSVRVSAQELTPGDELDFLVVDGVEPGRYVRLVTHRAAPGRGVLELSVAPADGGCVLTLQTSWRASGARGQAYWWGLRPFNAVVLPDFLRAIAAG